MTLYIGGSSESGVRVVRLEGSLEADVVSELEHVICQGSWPVRLELSELRSVDAAGLAALRRLRAAGAPIVGASPYIRLLLGS